MTLEEYPILPNPELDFEATKQHFGTGSCLSGKEHLKLESGETLVYMTQQKEGNEMVFRDGEYIGRKCIHGIVVAGYLVKPTGLFSFFKRDKIKTIPSTEREQVKLEIEKVKEPHHSYVKFWN